MALSLGLAPSAFGQAEAPSTIGPERREVDVLGTDAGYRLAPGPSPEGDALVPPELIQPSAATYPPEELASRGQGSVELELLIDEHGSVESSTVVSSPSAFFTKAAQAAAANLKFKPAKLKDIPVPVRIHYRYDFVAPPPPPPKAAIEGQVRARGTRKPIPGATVRAPGPAGETIVQTDPSGHFRLELAPGEVRIDVSAPGYEGLTQTEQLADGQSLTVLYALQPNVINPYETIVRGVAERTEVSRVTLHEQEIHEVPGTGGDPFKVIMLMPGVSSVMSGLSYPVVRGTEPAATGYFIDGVRVPSLFHLMVGGSVIHPDFLETIDFFPGPVPSQYGRLLGGAVEGHIARTRDDHFHATASVDLINASAFAEVPIPETGTNVTLAGRFSYTAWLLSAAVNALSFQTKPSVDFWDYQARVEQKMGPGKLRLFAFGSSDVIGADQNTTPSFSSRLFSIFHRADLRYQAPLGVGTFESGLTWGWQKIGISGATGGTTVGEYSLLETSTSGRVSWDGDLLPYAHLKLGGDFEARRSYTIFLIGDNSSADSLSALPPLAMSTYGGAYAELALRPTQKLLLVPGVRADTWRLSPGTFFLTADPRLVVRYAATDELTLKAGAGIVHQAPSVLLNLPVLEAASLRYGLQEAAQFDTGADWTPWPTYEVSADAYYDPVFRAVEFSLTELIVDRRRLTLAGYNPGTPGYAYGLDLLVRHPIGQSWFGWISYSYQRSARWQTFSRFDDNNQRIGSVSGWVPFAFQQTHVANAALSYKFSHGWTTGFVLHFNTGRPETGDISSRSMREGSDYSGNPQWVYADRDRLANLPSFFRIDVRAAKAWTYRDFILELSLDLMNASLSQETLGYLYSTQVPPDTQAITLLKTPIRVPIVVPVLGLKGTY